MGIIPNIDMKTVICGIELKNPVIAASGTFGFGREHEPYMDLNKIGGIATKGITLNERKGNKPPRICEINNGIMNSVGLQNPGVLGFIKNELSYMRQFDTKIFVNIAGSSIEEYCQIAEILSDQDIDGIELNVSCPNVKEGCLAFGNTANGIYKVTAAVRSHTNKPLIVKLTPNVTDIVEIAFGAEAAGADCLSMINTITGMAIDIKTRKPRLSNITGGVSGPIVKPIAVRMVYEAAKAVKIPVIGMGGIISGEDAIEFFMAGAKAVMVGTANLIRPDACAIINEEIKKFLIENNYASLDEIIGKINLE